MNAKVGFAGIGDGVEAGATSNVTVDVGATGFPVETGVTVAVQEDNTIVRKMITA
jgi:hypothetical protein